jgi:hypothetical protein
MNETAYRNTDIRDEVRKGVSCGKDGETNDGWRKAEDDAKGLRRK